MQSGLSTRIAIILLERVGTTPWRLMLGVFLLAAGLAHLMPEHAVAAMLLPVIIEIARALGLPRGRSRMGAGLFLAIAWGSIIGGIATFLGGARAPLALQLLRNNTSQMDADGRVIPGTEMSIGFIEWWIASLPLVALASLGAVTVLWLFFRPEIQSTEAARTLLRERLRLMGRATLEERVIGVVVIATIIGWIFGEHVGLDLSVVALLGAVALFVLGVISWRAVEEHVNWGVILMYGGAIALGQAMHTTGAAEHLASVFISDRILQSPTLTLALLALIALILTEGMSNSAVVAVLLPVGLDLAPRIGAEGVDPRLVVYAITLPAGLAFTLPISSPPNALAHSTGFVRMRHVFLRGPLLNVICFVAFLLVVTLWWPHLVK
jgi:sodium-dependent dicarboxylate transporter 2/3/5